MDNKNNTVIICRRPGDYEGGLYDASKIKNIHWGRCSGGVNRLQNGWSLYGYIPYEDAEELVACSGRHNFGYNDAKICVVASTNADRPAYYRLVEMADERAGCGIAGGCPKGAPSATKRIRQIVAEKGEVSRGELKSLMLEEGYSKGVIPKAIKLLYQQNVLSLDGDSRSPKQVISFR